jgi:hypothetical protein
MIGNEIRDRPRFLLMCVAIIAPCFAVGAPASVAGGKAGGLLSTAPAPTMTSTGRGGGGGGRQRIDPRQVPPLDPNRGVSEQDCSKPVDLTRGNLKCK